MVAFNATDAPALQRSFACKYCTTASTSFIDYNLTGSELVFETTKVIRPNVMECDLTDEHVFKSKDEFVPLVPNVSGTIATEVNPIFSLRVPGTKSLITSKPEIVPDVPEPPMVKTVSP